jgi:hypothetical protein
MKNPDISQILEELYALDPSLKEHGPALQRLLPQIVAAKPSVVVNEEFRNELRAKLAEAAHQPQPTGLRATVFHPRSLALAMLVVLVVGGALAYQNFRPGGAQNGVLIVARGDQAFGSLSGLVAGTLATERNASDALGSGEAVSSMPRSGGMGASDEVSIMPYPDVAPEMFTYKVRGTVPVPSQASMPVFMRAVERMYVGTLSSFGLIDTRGLRNPFYEMISLRTEDGYTISIDASTGSVSFYAFEGHGGVAVTRPATKELIGSAERPAAIPESEAISIANAFVKKYGISTAGYKAPAAYVQAWDDFEGRMTTEIVYQLELNGIPVFATDGMPEGIRVSINNQSKRVQSAMIRANRFESSSYKLSQDSNAIKAAAESTMQSYYFGENSNATTTELELHSPELVYMAVMKWESDKALELFVPAYRFKVENVPTGRGMSHFALVALVPELWNQEGDGMRGSSGAAGGSAGTIEPAILETRRAQ